MLTVRNALLSAYRLLLPRDRRTLVIVAALQSALALFDVVAIALLGLAALLATGAVSGWSASLPSGWDLPVIVEGSSPSTLALVLGSAGFLLFAFRSATSLVLIRWTFRFLASTQAEIASRLTSRFFSQSLTYIQRRPFQFAAYALTAGVNSATLGLLGQAVILVVESVLLFVLVAGLVVTDPLVALSAIPLFAAASYLLYRHIGGQASRLGSKSAELQVKSNQAMHQAQLAYKELLAMGRRPLIAQQVATIRRDYARTQAQLQFLSQVPRFVLELLVISGLLLLSITQILSKPTEQAILTIAVFFAAATRILPAITKIQGSLIFLRSQAGVADYSFTVERETRSGEALDRYPSARGTVERIVEGLESRHSAFVAEVACNEVTFFYPGNDYPAIQEFTITAKPATSLALVGPSGAGKTTIADLMIGSLEPLSGAIRVSGMSPQEAIAKWPGAISFVPQDVVLVDGSVRRNIAFGLPDGLVSDDLIWEALELARLDHFFRTERNGLETHIGDHGIALSGGQRQRLGIARALLTKPKMLFLDEATSALDPETEKSVNESIQELRGTTTLIVIAHRLATVRQCQQVAYLESGKLRASGSFTDIRQKVPAFDRHAKLIGF